jgi:hypothetical protein
MLSLEDAIRIQVNRDEDCSETALRLMDLRRQMIALIGQRNALGGHERVPNVEERLKADYRAANPNRSRAPRVAVDEPRPLRILRLRAEIGELDGAIRQLRRSGMDSATAELLITRKRAELEDLLKARTDGRGAIE